MHAQPHRANARWCRARRNHPAHRNRHRRIQSGGVANDCRRRRKRRHGRPDVRDRRHVRARSQIRSRKPQLKNRTGPDCGTRHHGADIGTRRIPADVGSWQSGDAPMSETNTDTSFKVQGSSYKVQDSNLAPYSSKGFTLLELIIVITVIVVLMGLFLNRAMFYMEQAEKTAMEQVAGTIQSALIMQYGQILTRGKLSDVAVLAQDNPM